MTTDWKPRPWLAALLNLWGGLGHLYCGRLLVALVVPPLLLIWLLVLMLATFYVSTASARLGIAVLFLISRLAVLPSWGYVAARRTPPGPKRAFQRWYALAAYAITVTLLAIVMQRVVTPMWMTWYHSTTGSMTPTVQPGDYVLAAIDDGELRRGEVVLTTSPDSGSIWFRRVIGVPGDRVELRHYRAYINGQPENSAFGACRPTPPEERGEYGPVDVPEGHYALFGDCRDNARDQRLMGFTPRADIMKRKFWIVWSADANGPRFDRIGQTVR